ncbi:MAG: two-component regulator propeller domain-containing protein [Flavobacteriales bacterium]
MMERWRLIRWDLLAQAMVMVMLIACGRSSSIDAEQARDEARFINLTPRKAEVTTASHPFKLSDLPRIALKAPKRIELPAGSVELRPATDITSSVLRQVDADAAAVVITKHLLQRNVLPLGLPRRTPVKEPRVREHNPDCFSCFSKNQGLPQDVVHAMLQDRDGNIWFATGGGLSRYDGHAFTNFGEEEGLPPSAIWSLIEDQEGAIWFGGFSGSLGRIDGGSITLFTDSTNGLKHGITSMLEDTQGRIWLSTEGGGLGMIEEDTLTVYMSAEAPTANELLSIHSQPDGGLWIGTRGNGAARFDGHAFQWHHFPNDTVRKVFSGSDGALWICTNGGIVHHKGGRFEHYGKAHGLPSEVIRRGIRAPDGSAWFASIDNGIFNIHQGRLQHYTDANGMPTNDMRSLLLDNSGTLWVGTGGDGACRYDGHRFRHLTKSNGLPAPHMKSLLVDHDQRLWLGSFEHGLLCMEGDGLLQFDATSGLPTAPITSMVQDAAGRLWCAFNGAGAVVIDGMHATLLNRKNGLPSDQVGAISIDAAGTVWLGTRAGLARIRNDSMEVIAFADEPEKRSIRFVHAAQSGRVWVAMHDVGVAAWHHGEWQLIGPAEGLPHVTATCALEDQRGWTWLGTHNGLLVLTPEGARHLAMREGLCNDQLSSLVEDAHGNIVYGTRFGMGRILIGDAASHNHWRIENFGFSEGFHGGGVNDGQTMARAADGTIYIATNTDLTAYTPDVVPHDAPPAIRLDAIGLFGENVDWTRLDPQGHARIRLANGIAMHKLKHAGLAPWSRMPMDPSFSHDNNFLTLHFTGVSTDRPTSIRYRWKLEGLEDNWSTPSQASSAQYGNLEPGNYTFIVQAANSFGTWSAPLQYPFTIRPHWSATWWAYTGYVLLSVLLVLGYTRWRIDSLKARQTALKAEVERATRSMRQQMERAEESERHKQQFLANMSHEIRTPMNAIMGMSGILKRSPHTPEQKNYLDAIAQSSENLLVIINDILDLSKLEAGRISFEQVPFEPRTVLAGVLEILRFKAEEKGLALTVDVDSNVPVHLLGDPTRLNQILLNLASNALKFTEHGMVSIHMRCVEVPEDGPGASIRMNRTSDPLGRPGGTLLVLHITDTGIGIPPERLDTIFEEFTQANSDTTRNYGGTGLGLTISKRLAEFQGGSITVQSEVGKGSTFTVSIPYPIAKADVVQADHDPRQQIALQDLRILLAEDNAFNAMVAQDELADAIPGVMVELASNGRLAVEMLRANDYDLILMDVQMPEMNGYDATRAIRAMSGPKGRTPIVAMTANVLREEVKRCKESGMDGYVPKPFKREELMRALSEAIRPS